MTQRLQLEYFFLRYAPNVVRDEFINIGLVMIALGDADFGEARFLKDWTPVLDFDPDADLDFLKEFASDIKERIRSRKNREQLLRQMKESFSNTIQLSPPRVCVSEDAQSELERLSAEYLPGKSHSA